MPDITLSALEAALAPIEEIGQAEITFPVETERGPLEVTLHILLPEEENEVQRYAAHEIDGVEGKTDA